MDVEVCVLANLFFGDALETVNLIQPEWFWNTRCASLFSLCRSTLLDGKKLFRSDIEVEHAQFADIVNQAHLASTVSPQYAASKMRDAYLSRSANTILKKACNPEIGEQDIYDTASGLLSLLSGKRKAATMHQMASEAITRWEAEARGLKYLAYGLPGVDKFLKLRHGNSFYVVAPPKTGKSWQAVHLAIQLEMQGEKVLLLSWEMTKEEFFERVVSYVSGFDATVLGTPHAPRRLYEKYNSDIGRIINLNIEVEECHGVNHDELRSKLHWASALGFTSVIIDYIQKVPNPKARDKRLAVSSVSELISNAAKQHNLVVVGMSQAGRGSHGQTTEMWNAKESSSIEEDADIILTLTDVSEKVSHDHTEKPLMLKLIQRKGFGATIPATLKKYCGHITGRANDGDSEAW